MADILNTRILVPTLLEEAGSMGAAVTGGVGVGLYKDFHAVERFLEINTIQEPNAKAAETYKQVKELFDECYFALKNIFPKLTA